MTSLYSVAILVALTQGPVYRMWGQSAIFLQFAPEPSIPHAYFATFVALQIPAAMWWWRHVSTGMLQQPAVLALGGLLGWLGLSVLWSTLARHSMPEFVSLTLTTAAGLFLAHRFSTDQLWRVVGSAMAIGLGLSLFAVGRRWDGAVDPRDDYWIGIYFNRNSLAPVAAVALVSAVGMLLTAAARRQQRRVIEIVAGLGLLAISILVLWRAESRTSPLALALATAATGCWLALRWWEKRTGIGVRIVGRAGGAVPVTLVVSSAVVFVALRYVIGLSSVSGETATFNSRAGLWSQNWTGFLEKPLQGWGWMAARRTKDFFLQGVYWAAFPTEWSHNGYHDLLLGGGVLAMVLFIMFLWFASRRIDINTPLHAALPRFVVVVFVLTAATQESFFIGSHFLWAMLIAALFSESTPRRIAINEHHTSERPA